MTEEQSVVSAVSVEVMSKLLDAGAQAPSGDNMQPWQIEVRDETILVSVEVSEEDSFFDYGGFGSDLGCGTFVENVCVAAGLHDLTAHVAYLPDPSNADLLASISFVSRDDEPDPLAGALWERHTNRTKFDRREIPESDFHRLASSLDDVDGFSLRLLTDRSEIREIARMVYHADVTRAELPDVHWLLMHMIRFSDQEMQATRDGLPLKNLEAGLQGELFLRATRSWRMANLLNRLGASKVVGLTGKQGANQSSAVGAILYRPNRRGSISEDGVRDSRVQHVQGGQALERVWLTSESLGLSFQPLAMLPILKMRWDAEEQSSLSAAHQKRLQKIWPSYEQLLGSDESTAVLMLFRIGYGKEVKVKTLRKPLP